jgi:hypothetical protein
MTVALPDPLPPDVTVNHESLEVAVHVHDEVVVITAREPTVPAAGSDALAGSRVYPQVGDAAAACVTVNVFPATVIVPVRAALPVFAVTE